MSDVLERLQARADGVDQFYGTGDEALDREAIAEIGRLRSALAEFAERSNWYDDGLLPVSWSGDSAEPWNVAARALTPPPL